MNVGNSPLHDVVLACAPESAADLRAQFEAGTPVSEIVARVWRGLPDTMFDADTVVAAILFWKRTGKPVKITTFAAAQLRDDGWTWADIANLFAVKRSSISTILR